MTSITFYKKGTSTNLLQYKTYDRNSEDEMISPLKLKLIAILSDDLIQQTKKTKILNCSFIEIQYFLHTVSYFSKS